jgi:hypothetical protein
MKITVNGETKLDNFPADLGDYQTFLKDLTEEQKADLAKDDRLFEFPLDHYTLPSLLIKIIKSMKKYEVCELVTPRIDKLRTNFPN